MTEKRVEKKMNSYLKMILMMCLGGAIGAVFGVGLVLCEDGMAGMLQAFSGWLRASVVPILWVFVAASLAVSIVCYRKAESYVQKMDEEDDSLMEELDQRYEAWSSAGMLASSVLMCLSMVIFAFGFPVTEEEVAYQRLGMTVIPFLATVLVCVMYQIAAVKQLRRKDPSKKGDASDLHFEKEWIESCDEAERMVIYKSSYKAFTMMKTLLMILLTIAMLGQLSFGTGMTAVVLLALANIIMLSVYSAYSMKFQKTKFAD